MGAFLVNTEALLEITGNSEVVFVERYMENGVDWESYESEKEFKIQHAGGDRVRAKIFFDVSFEPNGETYLKFLEYSLITQVSDADLDEVTSFFDHQLDLTIDSMITGKLN